MSDLQRTTSGENYGRQPKAQAYTPNKISAMASRDMAAFQIKKAAAIIQDWSAAEA